VITPIRLKFVKIEALYDVTNNQLKSPNLRKVSDVTQQQQQRICC